MARKISIYLRIVILILGLTITIFGSLTREKAILVERKESERESLTLSAYFKRGQKLGFGISKGNGWEYFLDTSDEFKVGGQYIDYVPVTVLITTEAAPGKNITLEVEYSLVETQGPTILLDVFVVKVTHKSDILKMETSIENWVSGGNIYTSEYLNERKPQLGIGTIQYDGVYQVEIIAVGYIKPPPQPPRNIVLYIYNVEKVMDYWYFIPVGSVITALGVFILINYIKGSRKKARKVFAKKAATSKSLKFEAVCLKVKALSKWNTLMLILGLLILFSSVLQFTNFGLASNVIYVDPGDSIQRAINNASSGDILLIRKGVYKEYPIIVNKSLNIIGEDVKETIIDGEELAIVIFNILADNVKISNLTIQRTSESFPQVSVGIQILNVKNVEISDCVIWYCAKNLRLSGSRSSKILRNKIEHSLTNGYGIHLDENSEYNEIINNYIAFNNVGIQVESTAANNIIYHNNFLNNTLDIGGPRSGAGNRWHNGYPSGGNFWDKSSKVDLKNGAQQSEEGSDGICDQSYNYDLYPLMGLVYVYKAGKWGDKEYYVPIICDSEILDFQFNEESTYIQFVVLSFQKSFLRVIIPKPLLWIEENENWEVYLNETLIENINIKEDLQNTYVYFTCNSGFWIAKISGAHAIPETINPFLLILLSTVVNTYMILKREIKPKRKVKTSLLFRRKGGKQQGDCYQHRPVEVLSGGKYRQ